MGLYFLSTNTSSTPKEDNTVLEVKDQYSGRKETSAISLELKMDYGKGGLGGEVRRLHIIYFLTHLGRSEHPHLIRVHHVTRTGVYLRDVKRWLGDLRGKDMPEAYAWSYKRRYKTGYVWQDLMDDDLITPLSDNEYVLKGSEIFTTPNNTIDDDDNDDEKSRDINARSYSCAEKKAASKSTEQPTKVNTTCGVEDDQIINKLKAEAYKKLCPDPPTTKTFSKINEESDSFGSERSTLTDEFDSVKLENDNHLGTERRRQEEEDVKPGQLKNIGNIISPSPPALYCDLPSIDKKSKNKKKKKKKKNKKKEEEKRDDVVMGLERSWSSSKSPLPANKRKSFSGGASHVLRNFITCGAVDTNDAVLVTMNRRHGKDSSNNNNNNNNTGRDHEVLKGCHMRPSTGVSGTCTTSTEEQRQQKNNTARRSYDERKSPKKEQQQQSEFTKQRAIPAAYRPVREPNCSQCGKAFKPEKMHSHMKSCRGMKALAKNSFCSASASSVDQKSTTVSHFNQESTATSSYKESALGYFLTN